ncbi:MAG: DpnI domain-containing protein, partial [Planctomycetia bacterium]|nr:DpnI domain-containing protein [Planctomycetia bacterium]
MNLYFDMSLVEGYQSVSQRTRLLTENWVAQNMFCPRCGHPELKHFQNNYPVADFFCPNCQNQFELKSKNGFWGGSVNDGAYH